MTTDALPWGQTFDLVADFGGVGDGTTDNAPMLADALRTIRALDAPGTSRGARLFIPPGRYRTSETIHIDRGMSLVGASGGGWYGGSRLAFDDGVPGIVVHRYNTSADGGRGDWSTISDLVIEARGKTTPDIHGIDLQARACVERVYVTKFSGCGIHVDSRDNTNVNSWRLDNLRIDNCTSHGVFVEGPDSNAGVAINVDSSSNGGWGVWDSSFLGCHWFGCHAQSNGLGAYQADGSASATMFLGCYSEGGQPPSRITGTALVIGGTHGAGFTDDTSVATLSGSSSGVMLRGVNKDRIVLHSRATPTGPMRWALYADGRQHYFDDKGVRVGYLAVNAAGSLVYTNAKTNTATVVAP